MSFERNRIKGKNILQLRRQEIDPEVDIFQGEEKRKASAQLRKAKKHLTKCRNNSYKLRQEYLQRKAEEMVPGGEQEEIQKMVKQMKHQEARIRMYAIMKRYLKPERDGGTSFIMVPDKE
eukprot:13910555-Ditylum_brightwellii.AAC.1